MPKNKEPYQCPRCGYETRSKPDMRKHLYKLKSTCPGQKNKIELTDLIREEILRDRVYEIHKEKENPKCTLNLNNYVFEMDTKDKIDSIMLWNDRKQLNFGDQLEQDLGPKIKKLEDRSYKYGFQLKKGNLLELVDQSIQINSQEEIHKLNLLYISELNKIAIYHDDEWTHYLFDSGLNQIINIIRNYFLESYEKYMLYKIFVDKQASPYEANIYKNLLIEYFYFLIAFDTFPSSKDCINGDFLQGFSHDNKFFISDYCMELYNKQKETMKTSDNLKLRKDIGNIVKTNNGANLKILNKHIINLAVNDEEFKEHLLSYTK